MALFSFLSHLAAAPLSLLSPPLPYLYFLSCAFLSLFSYTLLLYFPLPPLTAFHFCTVLSFPVISFIFISCAFLSSPFLSSPVLSSSILPGLFLFSFFSSFLTCFFSCTFPFPPLLSFSVLYYLSFHLLSFLCCNFLSLPALSFPFSHVLSSPVLSCPSFSLCLL